MIGTPRKQVIEWSFTAPADGARNFRNTAAVTAVRRQQEEEVA